MMRGAIGIVGCVGRVEAINDGLDAARSVDWKRCGIGTTYPMIEHQWPHSIDVIGTLGYSGKVEVATDAPTSGCAIVTVSDKCTAHLVLTGLIDPTKEVEKLLKKETRV